MITIEIYKQEIEAELDLAREKLVELQNLQYYEQSL